MKFKGMLVSDLSGSAGGITASRNRYGGYLRQKVAPVNPSTPFQEVVRNAQLYLTARWVETLTANERLGWDTYASIVAVPSGGEGAGTFITGQNQYIRSNVARLQSALPVIDTPPSVYDLATFASILDFTVDESDQEATLTFEDEDFWVTDTGAFMAVFLSRPQNQTKNFFKGPYRLAAAILGDATTPPTSPATIAVPFPVGLGNKVFYKVTVGFSDGRYSVPFRGVGSVVA